MSDKIENILWNNKENISWHKRGQRTFGALTGRSGVAGLDREPKKRSGFSGEIFCDSNFARPLATAPCKKVVKRENKMVAFPLSLGLLAMQFVYLGAD